MNWLTILIIWFVASIALGLIVGPMMHSEDD